MKLNISRIVGSGIAAIGVTSLMAIPVLAKAPPATSNLLTPTKAHVTITYSAWGTPSQIVPYQNEAKAFMKLHPNVTVVGQFLPWSENEQKLITEVAAHDLPDVMATDQGWFTEFAQKGGYLNLEPYFKASGLKAAEFGVGAVNYSTINGKLVQIPFQSSYPMSSVVIIYNKKMFQKAHLAAPSRNWTLQQFVQTAKLLTLDSNGKNATQKGFNPKNVVQWGTDLGPSSTDAVWDEMLPAFGGWYWNANKTKSTIDSPAGIKAATFLNQLVNTDHVSMPAAAQTGISDPFAADKVAMEYAWYSDATAEHAVVNFPMGVTTVPIGPDGRGFFQVPKGGSSASNGWTIAANTKHPRTAWEFLRFLATSPVAVKARGLNDALETMAYKPLDPMYLKMLPRID
ncbi:MAG: sugar ABC transporter substrate-binding protein, partial [Firmicutes bacterium]|nr:sugar ABC transporter substrate-binding protein [Bacillota bacterium]